MKKIIVSGSNGFLGRNLVEYFHDVSPDYKVYPIERTQLDWTNADALTSYVKEIKPDYIIHAAVSYTNLEENLRMYFALEQCSSYVERIVMLGSGVEYLKQNYKPLMREEYFMDNFSAPVIENHDDEYNLSKYSISRLHMHSNCSNIYNLRLFGVYGKYEDFTRRLISNNIVRHLNGLSLLYQRDISFDFLYVSDFLDSLERFITLEKPMFNTYNLCTGTTIKFKVIMNTIADVIGIDRSKVILVDNTPCDYQYSGSSDRLRQEIGSIQKTKLYQGISELYDWYKALDFSTLTL